MTIAMKMKQRANMEKTKQEIKAAAKAIKIAGGPTACARKLTLMQKEHVTRDRVQKWLTRGVTSGWVLYMEELTGVSRHDLDKRLYPK